MRTRKAIYFTGGDRRELERRPHSFTTHSQHSQLAHNTDVVVVRRNHLIVSAAAGSAGYLNYDRTSCMMNWQNTHWSGQPNMQDADTPDMQLAEVSGLSSPTITMHVINNNSSSSTETASFVVFATGGSKGTTSGRPIGVWYFSDSSLYASQVALRLQIRTLHT